MDSCIEKSVKLYRSCLKPGHHEIVQERRVCIAIQHYLFFKLLIRDSVSEQNIAPYFTAFK